MALVGRVLMALRSLSCLSTGPANLEKLGVVAFPASRLLHSSQHCASSDQLSHEGGSKTAPFATAAEKESYEAVHQLKNRWTVLAACLTSFGIGALVGAEMDRKRGGVELSQKDIHDASERSTGGGSDPSHSVQRMPCRI